MLGKSEHRDANPSLSRQGACRARYASVAAIFRIRYRHQRSTLAWWVYLAVHVDGPIARHLGRFDVSARIRSAPAPVDTAAKYVNLQHRCDEVLLKARFTPRAFLSRP